MAVAMAEEFFAVLEKSKLLIPAQLAQARQIAGPDEAPRTIAKTLARQGVITRWQAGQLLAGRSSFYLGKYRLIELLGRGGAGNVFLGEHVTMSRRVALKIVPRPLCMDPAALKRFLAEVPAIAALDHPNIVRVYSVDNEGDRYYIVMEYVEGADLQRLVEQQGPLESTQAADYVIQAADGLEHVHRQDLVHGDMKPSSLLVNPQGVVKILDVGLTQFGNEPAAARGDARSDIFSLGRTLYFLLTGKPQSEYVVDRRALPPEVPAGLAAVYMKMTAPRPEDRYPSAAEASRALAQWRASMSRTKPLPMAKRL